MWAKQKVRNQDPAHPPIRQGSEREKEERERDKTAARKRSQKRRGRRRKKTFHAEKLWRFCSAFHTDQYHRI